MKAMFPMKFFLGFLLLCTNALSQVVSSDSLQEVSTQNQRARSPSGAALRSLLIPGWGQYYNGQKIKAGLALAGEVGLLSTALYWNSRAAAAQQRGDQANQLLYEDWRNGSYWGLAALIVYSMLDAYVDAQLSDFDESPVLAPPASAAVLIRIKFHL